MKDRRQLVRCLPWAAALFAVVAACSEQPPPKPGPLTIPVVEVQKRDVPVEHEWLGETIGSVDVRIDARVPGFLEKVHFDEGSFVRKGQLLYTIEQSPYAAQVAHARGQLEAVQAERQTAVQSSQRYQALVGTGAVSKQERDQAVGQAEQARAQIEAARAGLKQAHIQLSYTEIRSPIAGLIGRSRAKVGDLVGVGAAMQLDTVSAIDPIHVRFSIGEGDYLDLARQGLLRPAGRDAQGEHAAIGADSPPPVLQLILSDGSIYPRPGAVVFADRALDPATGSLVVEARFPNPNHLLRPGQFVRVHAVTGMRRGVVLVPQRSVQQLQDQYFVYVVGDDAKVKQRGVVPGERVGGMWVIDSGLEPGDRVVYEGLQKVRPGQKVKPKRVKPSAASAPDGGA